MKVDDISLDLDITNYEKIAGKSNEIYYYKINPNQQYSKANYIYISYPQFEGENLEIINLSSSLIMNGKEIKKYGTYTIDSHFDFSDKIFYLNLTSFKSDDEIYLEISVYDGILFDSKLNYGFYRYEITETNSAVFLNSKVDCYHEASNSNSNNYYEPGMRWDNKKKYYYKLVNKGYKYLFFKISTYSGEKVEIKNAESSLEDTLLLFTVILPIVLGVLVVALII